MKKIQKVITILIIAISSVFLHGCNNSPTVVEIPTVMDVEIKNLPKTEYYVGDTLDIDDGVLTLIYTDDSTKTVEFTSTDVIISNPNMSFVGTKTVTVDYQGFIVTYQITVVERSYTVTFDYNYQEAPNASEVAVVNGTTVARPSIDPVRSGYRFDGWYTQVSDGSQYIFSTTISNDIILYAHWTQLFNITFDLNYEGAPASTSFTVAQGDQVPQELAPITINYEGFIFDGWHTDSTNPSPFDFSSAVTQNVMLYAHWEEITQEDIIYDVVFSYNYVGAPTSTITKVKEGNKVAQPSIPIRYGYTFNGWHIEEVGSSLYDFNTQVTKQLTLYAQWEISFYVITYKYILNSEELTHEVKEVTPNIYVGSDAIPMPVVNGYYFTPGNWYIDNNFSTTFDFDNILINQNYTLYAKPLKNYIFEAEYTYIHPEKSGYGSSNAVSGVGLMGKDNGTANASNGFWVGNLFYNGAYIEFVINSSKDVSDAVLTIRLSAEWEDMFLAPSDIKVNNVDYYGFKVTGGKVILDSSGQPITGSLGQMTYDHSIDYNYDPIALEGAILFHESQEDKRPFDDYFITASLQLYEGLNVIRLTVNNNHSHDGTIQAEAPMVDCIYISSDSNLTWTPHPENITLWNELFN